MGKNIILATFRTPQTIRYRGSVLMEGDEQTGYVSIVLRYKVPRKIASIIKYIFGILLHYFGKILYKW